MKKLGIFALLICFALLAGFSAVAVELDEPAFVVSSATVNAGETVDITIRIVNNPGIASAKLEVTFDDTLALNSVAFNEDMGGMYVQPGALTAPVTLNWLDFAEDFNGDAVFATLNFTVAGDAAAGVYSIDVSYEAENVYNIAEDNVFFHVSNGGVTVAAEPAAQQPEEPEEPEVPPAAEVPDTVPEENVPDSQVPDGEAVSGAPEDELPETEAPDTVVGTDNGNGTVSVPQEDVPRTPVEDAEPSQTEDDGDHGLWLPVVLAVCAAIAVGGFGFLKTRAKGQKE